MFENRLGKVINLFFDNDEDEEADNFAMIDNMPDAVLDHK
jgi:hypothetical protein